LHKEFFFFFFVFIASDFLELRPRAEHAITILAKLALFLQIGFWGSAAISFFVDHHTKETLKRDAGRATTINAVGFLLE
ncbi:hypothetical protein C1882_29115, partial [Pseudomonas sp. FW305-E2]|uniref:hypothetical protein n=1 Tax=Pseudomonas sp. FW305-E2 TaxID=2075558 RepID=UPI000CD38F14